MTDVSKYLNPPPDACTRCQGCGQIANDDDKTPWWNWEALPSPSSMAVVLGLVRPEPCPECDGTGKQQNSAVTR